MINVKETKREFLMMLLDKNIKKILDLGCGKALMSKFFNKTGAKITGIDIKKIVEDSKNFKLIEGDIRREDFGEKNDLIIASLILHTFTRRDALEIIERMKTATANSGYNLLICISNEGKNVKTEKFYPNIEELIKIYNNWTLIKEIKGPTEIEDHHNLGSHQHNLIFILFKNK